MEREDICGSQAIYLQGLIILSECFSNREYFRTKQKLAQ